MDGYLYIAVFAGAYSAIVTIVAIILLIRSAVLRVRQERELRFFEISQDKLIGRVARAEVKIESISDDLEYYKEKYKDYKKKLVDLRIIEEDE